MDILVKNATIVTQNSKREIIRGDILVSGNQIAEVSGNIAEKAEIVINAENKIAMPGLANMHSHVAMTLFRGCGDGLHLQRWLEEQIWTLESRQTREDVYSSALLSFCEMIRSGTTSFCDMCVMGSDEIKRAAEKIGMRGMVGHALMDLASGRTTKEQLKLMKETVCEKSGLVESSIAPHSPYTCSEELLSKAKEFADKKGLRYQLHVSETRKEVLDLMRAKGKSPIEYLSQLGVIDRNSILMHASWVSKKEIAIAGKAGASVSHCPISNLKLATGGICPVNEYISAGANVVLGTDSAASNNSLNMFETMKMASLLQKHKYWKAECMDARATLDLATRNAGIAMGRKTGSIEKGNLADIILLDNGPNMWPANDPIANIVYSACPSNVTDVMIDGKIVMQSGKILLVDEKEIFSDAQRRAVSIIGRHS